MNIKLSGRVVDLKKLGQKEIKKEITTIKKVGFFVFLSYFFQPKKKSETFKTDFFKNYKKLQKREEFIEEEFLREFSEENVGKKIGGLFGLIFFICRFISILVSRIFVGNKKNILKAKKKKNLFFWKKFFSLTIFWSLLIAFLSLPKRIFFNKNEDDYFYHRSFLEISNQKKFKPLRRAVVFFVLAMVTLLPFKAAGYLRVLKIDEARARVVSVSEQALANLRSAAGAASKLDLLSAEEDFNSAKDNFNAAKQELSDVNDLLLNLGKYAPSEEIRLASYGKDMISAGEVAASAGRNLSLAGDSFISGIKDGKALSEIITSFVGYEKEAKKDIDNLNIYLKKIDDRALPVNYRKDFNLLKEKSADLSLAMSGTIEFLDKLNIFLGADGDKRYLFVFENNREMRASGGFIGSYALVDFSKGRLKNIEVPQGGSYDTEGGLLKKVVSPEPLWLVNPLWHFWDANWWPDWKTSAKKLSWFYEKSGGPTVDGVIAFTPTVLERMLETIGPIDMTEKYGVVVDSQNLWENLRVLIEKEKVEETKKTSLPHELVEAKPKKVIGDLFLAIISEMPKRLDKEKVVDLFLGLAQNLEEKQMLLYFDDDKLQSEAEKNNFAGRIKNTEKDYLLVVNTNIAGGKSDGKMKEEITHRAEVLLDGSIIDTLTIKRKHQGQVDEPFYGVRNVNWMRIYVPLGSQLLEVSGFRGPDPIYFSLPENDWEKDFDIMAEEGDKAVVDKENLNTKIYQESGKTVFSNWSMVDPGREAVITLKYKLPIKLEKKISVSDKKSVLDWVLEKTGQKKDEKDTFVYSLLAQKQAGSLFTSLDSSLVLDSEFSVSWKYPENLNQEQNSLFSGDLKADIYSAVILEKKKGSTQF